MTAAATTGEIVDICRYPVKGLNAESIPDAALSIGEGLPNDRRFALAHGSTKFDSSQPQWLPKTNFLMLLRNEKLAQLEATFDDATGYLTILRRHRQVVRAKITEPLGRTLVEQFFASYMGGESRGAPKLLEVPEHRFFDIPEQTLSLINLASVHDLERVVREPVQPLRFRANVYLQGLPAWREFDWAGKEISLGTARLRVIGPIDRCAAVNVNPETAERDLNIPLILKQGFGHVTMGVYAQVTGAGRIAKGDQIKPQP